MQLASDIFEWISIDLGTPFVWRKKIALKFTNLNAFPKYINSAFKRIMLINAVLQCMKELKEVFIHAAFDAYCVSNFDCPLSSLLNNIEFLSFFDEFELFSSLFRLDIFA